MQESFTLETLVGSDLDPGEHRRVTIGRKEDGSFYILRDCEPIVSPDFKVKVVSMEEVEAEEAAERKREETLRWIANEAESMGSGWYPQAMVITKMQEIAERASGVLDDE